MHLRQSPQLSAVNSAEPRPARGGDAAAHALPALLADDGAVAGPPPARSSAAPRSMSADAAARDSCQEVEATAEEEAEAAAAVGAAQLPEGTAAAAHELTVGSAEARQLHGVPDEAADMATEGRPRRRGLRCGLAGWCSCLPVVVVHREPSLSPAIGQR